MSEIKMIPGPVHTHDCDECCYLGSIDLKEVYDLYFCSEAFIPTVIARYGSNGPDYTSGMEAARRGVSAPLSIALSIAKHRKLVDEFSL